MDVGAWLEPRGLATLAVVVALMVALALPRAGAWSVRLWTLAVAAALALAVVGWTRPATVEHAARVRVVATAPVPAELRHALLEAHGARLDLIEAGTDAGAVALALGSRSPERPPATPSEEAGASASLGRGEVGDAEPPTERTLLWLAPIDGAGVPAAAVADVVVATAVAPLGFEPDAVELRLAGESRVGRPLALDLRGLPGGFAGTVRIHDAMGAVCAEAEVSAGRAHLQFVPERAGALAVAVEAAAGDTRFVARGALVVGPAPRVLALGPGAPVVAAALGAQGYRVDAADGLDATEALASRSPDVEVLVATGGLSPTVQESVQEFVAGGGGLLLVGGEDGGAVPTVGEPAAVLSPVLLRERPRPAPKADVPRDDPSPPHDPPPVEPPPAPPEPARGETVDAKPPTGPEVDVARRSVAMVFVLDRSESMLSEASPDGATRMDYVRSSAQATAGKLLPGDELAVVSFGNRDADEVLLPLTPASAFERVHRALAGLQARRHEGTYVHSALVRAQALLSTSTAAVKHVVVITDGQIEDLLLALERARALRAAGASVSMIRIGAEGEGVRYTDSCRQFASLGGGDYLPSSDSSEVLALVSTEVKRVLSTAGRTVADDGPPPERPPADDTTPESPKPEGPPSGADPPRDPPIEPPAPPVQPPAGPPPSPAPVRLAVRVLEASPLLAPLPDRPAPGLGGVLPVTARPEAHVLLVAGQQGWPLLAFKNYGLGRVAAWTADFAGDWSAEWRRAESFPAWLAQWTASVLPPTTREVALDVLTERAVDPRGPTPAEVAALERYSGTALRTFAVPPVPSPTTQRVERSLAGVLAWAAALALLVLAALEFVVARLAPRER
ncbi:MAG: VWA domain-containing protein [Planctomycetota bacterium]